MAVHWPAHWPVDVVHMRLNDETATARELYDRMLALYPDRINPGSLWGSANAAKARTGAKTSHPSA